MTAPTEPARPRLLDIDEAARQVRIHRERLERQLAIQGRDRNTPLWQVESTCREIRDDRAVERWLGQQLRNPGRDQ